MRCKSPVLVLIIALLSATDYSVHVILLILKKLLHSKNDFQQSYVYIGNIEHSFKKEK